MRRNRARFLPLGPISEGTLLAEDVIPELLDAARSVRMSRADRSKAYELRRAWERAPEDDLDGLAGEIWNDLLDLLTMYAPPGCYVGAHEGDGSAIGCWPSWDVPATVDDGPPDDDRAPDGVCFKISDHGNILGVWSACYAHGPETRWHYLPL